ncbi:hypothetical protein SAMN04515671_0816 [Nakamurella panacisegetis]|uniref:Uncharacterized protein n=1 Tax=Nakamurella panacisegetis TaxID=1090615 RepID=A0A1H0J8E3_9ACTN|nr:hypothetical protein [Nakamurella panacisegetis]SDO39914.1 hypothetical protein SAMN04515671_0816 [Nakamurella panacisegetis]
MTTPGTPDANQPPLGGSQPPYGSGDHPAAPPAGGYPPPTGAPAPYGAPIGNPMDPNAFAAPGYPPPAGAPAPYGAPIGNPVDPNAFAAPGYPPPGSVPPPPAAAGAKRNRLIIIGVVLLVIVAGVIFAVVKNQKTATTAANVGDCIKITSASTVNPDTSQAPCGEADAIFVVTETGGSSITCDSNETSYVEGKKKDNPDTRVCLRYNVKAGDCLDPGAADTDVPKKLPCAQATSSNAVKVVSLITDSADKSKCPGQSFGLPLTKRNMVYCLAPVS